MRISAIFGCVTVAILAVASQAFAANGTIGPVKIESVAVIGVVGYGTHLPGNKEIKIVGGFTPPNGVSCPGNGGHEYITTKKANDPDQIFLRMLITAYTAGRSVYLQIADDAVYTAWTAGTNSPTQARCSLFGVNLAP